MDWSILRGKKRQRSQKKDSEAYTRNFLTLNENKKPQEIVEEQVTKKLAVVSKIADSGEDEKNRLKAAISWLRFSRQLSEVHKVEVEGSLTLESRLNDALEEVDKQNGKEKE